MCEIAILDPEQISSSIVLQVAQNFHEEQGDGVGIVVVINKGDRFEYKTYKSTAPHWQTINSFLGRNYQDAWRIIVHGRYATEGDVNRKNAHPLEINCDECEFDYVIHNGSVRNYRHLKTNLHSDHTYNTDVDSEAIAHDVGTLPEDLDDLSINTYNIRGKLNYILLSANGIFIRTNSIYHLGENMTMTCSWSKFKDPEEMGFERGSMNKYLLATPGESVNIETKEREYKQWGRDRTTSSTGSNFTATGATYGTNNRVTIGYEDISEYDKMSIVKVAPGVLRIRDKESRETHYIYKRRNPTAYYFHVDEDPPKGFTMDQLEDLAEPESWPEGKVVEQSAVESATCAIPEDAQ